MLRDDEKQSNNSTTLRQRYAARIRAEREKRNLTQAELSKLTGLQKSYVSQVERGVVNISLDNLEKFQKALDLGISSDIDSLRARLAQRVRSARMQIGASQEALAELARVPVLYVNRVERGVVSTSVDQVEGLAGALKQNGEALLD